MALMVRLEACNSRRGVEIALKAPALGAAFVTNAPTRAFALMERRSKPAPEVSQARFERFPASRSVLVERH